MNYIQGMNHLKKWPMAHSMTIKKTVFFFTAALFLFPALLFGQEALLSIEEQYYESLALEGLTERPYLNYRTLSDSAWTVSPDTPHLWQDQNLGAPRYFFDHKLKLKIYGPEWFSSVNTAAPYGQNDGVLWQGKGYNTGLSGGVRLEAYGVELTLKPRLAFSQNLAFDYITPNYSEGEAAQYGYYGIAGIDAPQRFGDKPFFAWDLGDSEVRYSWKTLTAGFGTQPLWLGPAQLNPIIHSNNAPSYPRLDLGLRRQPIILPRIHWHLGDIETRVFWGYLSESDYFDSDDSNDHNLITGFSLAYSFPSVLKGLTIGVNRIMLSKWEDLGPKSVFTLLWPFMSNDAGSDNSDQRASLVVDYLLPIAQLNIYFEWARNDFSPTVDHVIRYPFHTEGYTLGVKKNFSFMNHLAGEILFEFTMLEGSKDYGQLFTRGTTFYAHHIITQGHTNRGQWLGAGIGTGGNSQYLGFKLYFPKGYGQFIFQRRNPDMDYTWYMDSKNQPMTNPDGTDTYIAERNIRAFLDFGISGLYYITRDLCAAGEVLFRDEHNPLNRGTVLSDMQSETSIHRYNVYISLSLKYCF
jgi:hypothetical protein